jgi:hypothetical protein
MVWLTIGVLVMATVFIILAVRASWQEDDDRSYGVYDSTPRERPASPVNFRTVDQHDAATTYASETYTAPKVTYRKGLGAPVFRMERDRQVPVESLHVGDRVSVVGPLGVTEMRVYRVLADFAEASNDDYEAQLERDGNYASERVSRRLGLTGTSVWRLKDIRRVDNATWYSSGDDLSDILLVDAVMNQNEAWLVRETTFGGVPLGNNSPYDGFAAEPPIAPYTPDDNSTSVSQSSVPVAEVDDTSDFGALDTATPTPTPTYDYSPPPSYSYTPTPTPSTDSESSYSSSGASYESSGDSSSSYSSDSSSYDSSSSSDSGSCDSGGGGGD